MTNKGKAFAKFKSRYEQRIRSGYIPTKEIDFEKFYRTHTQKQIEQLRGKELNKYFNYVDTETGEIFKTKREATTARKRWEREHKTVDELGYDSIPTESTFNGSTQSLFDNIISLISNVQSHGIVDDNRKIYTELNGNDLSDIFVRLFWDTVYEAEDRNEVADYFESIQGELAENINKINEVKYLEYVTRGANQVAFLLARGVVPTSVLEEINNAIEYGGGY